MGAQELELSVSIIISDLRTARDLVTGKVNVTKMIDY